MIIEANDLLPKLLDLRKTSTARRGLSTGFQSIDEFMLLSKQYLMVITGMPSSGKSEVLDAIAVNMAVLHNWNWLYFSPENFPLEEHMKKIIEKKVGEPLFRQTVDIVSDAAEWMQDHFAWIHSDEDKFSLTSILEVVEQRIEMGHNVDAVVIDPWNEVDHSAQSGLRDDQYISKCLTTIRRFHRKHDILTCIVIHPKAPQKDSSGNYPVPTLYDCNGGAMWRNKADFGICVHRPDMTKHEAQVIMQKIKFKYMGRPGKVVLDYDVASGRFKDQSAPYFTIPEVYESPF